MVARGIRNNNPGNIRWGDKWQGLDEDGREKDKSFCVFVKPEYASLSERKINEKANSIAVNTGSPPKSRKGRKRVYSVFSPVVWALIGATVGVIVIKCFGL